MTMEKSMSDIQGPGVIVIASNEIGVHGFTTQGTSCREHVDAAIRWAIAKLQDQLEKSAKFQASGYDARHLEGEVAFVGLSDDDDIEGFMRHVDEGQKRYSNFPWGPAA